MADPFQYLTQGVPSSPNLTGTLDTNSFAGPNIASGGAGASSGGGAFGGIGGLLGPAVAGGALAYDLFQGNQQSAPEQALTAEAGQLGNISNNLVSQGTGLQSYLETGTLPVAQQAQLDMAQNAAKAAIIQGTASKGQNANPMKNSGLTQDLNSLNLQALSEKGALENQLFQAGTGLVNEGVSALGMESNIQAQLAAIDAKQQQDTTNAIMGFAKALGGMDWGKIGASLGSLGPLLAA